MAPLPKPHSRPGPGKADWYPRAPIGIVRRLGHNGPVQLSGHDHLGNPVTINLTQRQAAAVGPAITAAAQPKEKNR